MKRCNTLLGVPGALSRSQFQRKFYTTSQEKIPQIFNRETKSKQRERAAADPDEHDYQYVRSEVAKRLTNRLHDIEKNSLPYLNWAVMANT